MPSLVQVLLLIAVPILGIAIFFSSQLQDATDVVFDTLGLVSSGPQVKLLQGTILGTVLDDKFPAPIEAFLGLPYAQSPTGERRFRRPVPLSASNETVRAKRYGVR